MTPDRIVTNAIITLFTFPGAALLLSAAIFGACILVLATTFTRQVAPLKKALQKRLNAVADCVSGDTAERLRASFSRNVGAVHDAMSARDRGSYVLQRAWLDYEQSFVDIEPEVVASSSRAGMFFHGAGDPGRAMDWWANIFVAVGLMFTFLGIVAALSQATAAIGAGQDAQVMQKALAGLLEIAAAKFWTSIAGVGASLVLRLYGRRWRTALERLEDELCEVLDAGVRHISPQVIALRQLVELQKLNGLLEQRPVDRAASALAPAPVLAHVREG